MFNRQFAYPAVVRSMMFIMLASTMKRLPGVSSWSTTLLRSTETLKSLSPGTQQKRFYRSTLFAGRKRRKSSTSDTEALSWETFEFGDSPKWDDRFASSRTVVAANEEELQEIRDAEATKDEEMSKQLNENTEAWHNLDADLVARATAILKPYVRPERLERIEHVLQQRTQNVRFLFENPVNPSNVWACLRTLDAFGLQHIDVVLDSQKYKGKAALSQKRGMRTAMGSAQWLSLRNHASTADAIEWLKARNYVILASDLSDRSQDIRKIDWDTTLGDQPVCIAMGNEETGISDELRQAAHGTFYLPMAGFAESFNLSVATAITAAHLSAASSNGQGPIRPGDLPKHQYNCLVLKGLLNSVAQKRMAHALLKQEGIVLPKNIIDLV